MTQAQRAFAFAAVLIAGSLFCFAQSFGQLTMTGAGGGGFGGGGTFATLDPAKTSSNISLDATHLILTATTGSADGDLSLSTTSHSSGKFYVEITNTVANGAGNVGWGIANASVVLANAGMGSTNSAGIFTDGGRWINGSASGTTSISSNTNGDVWGLKIDADGNTLSINLNGGSFSTAWDVSALTKPWFFASQGYKAGGVASVTTHNFNIGSPPPGYSNW